MSPSMNSSNRQSWLSTAQRRMAAQLARPQALFLNADGVQALNTPPLPPQALADWCRQHGGGAATLIVSTQLLHELVCEPGLPLDSEADLQAYARQQFSHYFGSAAKAWPLATWRVGSVTGSVMGSAVGSAPDPERCGASAWHGPEGAALAATAAEHQVLLRRVQPAWAPVLQRLAAQEPQWLSAPAAALAWVEGQVLTWLQLQNGQLQALRQLRLPAATPEALSETLLELLGSPAAGTTQRSVLVLGYGLSAAQLPLQALGSNAPLIRVLAALDGSAPLPAWFTPAAGTPAAKPLRLPQPDFLRPQVQRSSLAWPLAACGGLVLATAGWALLASHQQLTQAQEQVAQLDEQARSLLKRPGNVARPVPASARAPAAKAAELDMQRSAAEVQALLQQAWEPLLSNVEQAGLLPASKAPGNVPGNLPGNSAAPLINWLSLDYSAGRNELRLEGLVQDKLLALQLVDRLSAAPGWRDVMLSRFQTGEQGLSGQRFELSAKLRAAQLSPAWPNLPNLPNLPLPTAAPVSVKKDGS